MVLLFALPNTIVNIVLQHSTADNSDLGCNPGYEKIGNAVLILLTEVLPIVIGFTLNLAIFCYIFRTMSKKAYPQSVRKRRRRVMYHYIIVCILSWTPTIIFYSCEICGYHSAVLEVVARGSLYLTGFSNFLVFGMQDPHLSRSFAVIFFLLGCGSCCLDDDDTGRNGGVKARLRMKEEQKSVMFTGHVESNADISKDKKNIYKYHKLSVEDKILLYEERPDLNPKLSIAGERRRRSSGSSSTSSSPSTRENGDPFYVDPGPPPAVLSTAGATPRANKAGDARSAYQQPSPSQQPLLPRDPGMNSLLLNPGGTPSSGSSSSNSGNCSSSSSSSSGNTVKSPGDRGGESGDNTTTGGSSSSSGSSGNTVKSPLKEPLLPLSGDGGLAILPQGQGQSGKDDRGAMSGTWGLRGAATATETDEAAGSPESKGGDLKKNDEEIGEMEGGGSMLDDGSNTPATVSIDSQPPEGLHADESDSSSDEGDEEDDGLEVPLGTTMTSIPRQITRSFSGDGSGGGGGSYVESLFGRSP